MTSREITEQAIATRWVGSPSEMELLAETSAAIIDGLAAENYKIVKFTTKVRPPFIIRDEP